MAVPYLIIDGYNLMHAAGIARTTYGPGDLERCRLRLLAELKSRLSSDVLKNTIVVFDAFQSTSDEHRRQSSGDLHIVYAPKGTDADSEIETMLRQHSVPKRVIVVSSDHRLHKAASRRKAKCVDSEEFWQSLEGPTTERPEPSAARSGHSESELQQWIDEFGDVPAATEPDVPDQSFDSEYIRRLQDELDRDRFQ